MLDSWKRPGELYAGNGTITPEKGAVFDLAQDVITDCSVVASLCSAIAREERSLGKVPSLYIYIYLRGDLTNLTDARLYQILYIRKIRTAIRESVHLVNI